MKQKIAWLRIAGIFCMLAFAVLKITGKSPNDANLLMWVSVSCFASVVLIQLYRFYIKGYMESQEGEAAE